MLALVNSLVDVVLAYSSCRFVLMPQSVHCLMNFLLLVLLALAFSMHLTIASAGVIIGCVVYLCLKSTVSASLLALVFLMKMMCVL